MALPTTWPLEACSGMLVLRSNGTPVLALYKDHGRKKTDMYFALSSLVRLGAGKGTSGLAALGRALDH